MDGHNGMKPSEANPSTTVHKLVRSLNEYVDWAISILKFIFRFSGHMACNPDFVQFIIDQCSDAGEIAVKKMLDPAAAIRSCGHTRWNTTSAAYLMWSAYSSLSVTRGWTNMPYWRFARVAILSFPAIEPWRWRICIMSRFSSIHSSFGSLLDS